VSPGVDPRRRLGPNDANGNIALHVWIVLLLVPVAAIPTAAMIVWSQLTGAPALIAAAVVVGLLNGVAAAWALGRVAIDYLSDRMPDVFTRIRYARVFHDADDDGVLAWVEKTTLKGEQDLADQKQKQREARLARAAR
jgi:ABC-2 type transport system permease protein